MTRILSSKKLLPNQKQYLLNAGLSVVEANFIAIKFNPFVTSGISENLIFTSTNAFKSFLQNEVSSRLKSRRIFCVGSKTKEFIEEAGFKVVESADYASELSQIIVESHQDKAFTFFSGSMRRDTLPEALKNAGVVCSEIEVYETVLTPHKINTALDGLLFFSPSGVESFLLENKITNQTCFCIGTTTAEALAAVTDNIVVANKPTVENVVVQCINYYKDN